MLLLLLFVLLLLLMREGDAAGAVDADSKKRNLLTITKESGNVQNP
jgi:hypothetical protein